MKLGNGHQAITENIGILEYDSENGENVVGH